MAKDKETRASLEKMCINGGGTITAVEFAFIFLFLPYIAASEYLLVYAIVLPLITILPFGLMPLCYNYIHGIKSLALGRFHGALIVSSLLVAVFNALFWGCFEYGGSGQAWAIIFTFAFLLMSILIYSYASSSIRIRLSRQSVSRPSRTHVFISAFGSVVTICAFLAAYYSKKNIYEIVGYSSSLIFLVCAFVEYLATFSAIPRLSSKRVRPKIADTFKTFYSGIKKLTLFTFLLFEAAFLSFALYLFYSVYSMGAISSIYAAVFAVSVTVATILSNKYLNKITQFVPSLCTICLVIAASACVLNAFIPPLKYVAPAVVALSIGVGIGCILREGRLRFTTLKSPVTSGVVEVLYNMTLAVALGCALLALMLTLYISQKTGLGNYEAIIVAAAAMAFGLCAFGISFKKYKYSSVTREVELKYDLNPMPEPVVREAGIVTASDSDENGDINKFDIDSPQSEDNSKL